MRVAVLARPDHSVALCQGLHALGADVAYHTFYAFRQGSLWSTLFPARRRVPGFAETSIAFTGLGYAVARAGPLLGVNWRKVEEWLASWLLRPADLECADVIHYWPFYYGKLVREWRRKNQGVVTIADYYEAEPSMVNAEYANAYRSVGLDFAQPLNEAIDQNAAFRFEQNFVVPSRVVQRGYLARFPEANIHIVPYGLMGMSIVPGSRKRPRRRWVFVGNVSVEKGVHTLLDAMTLCRELKLDLIGPTAPRQRAYFERRLRSAGNVSALGRLRRAEVVARLANYDAFVMPSLSEAYSLAVVEAIAAGLPVVVGVNCGNADDVERYDLGLVTPGDDPRRLAEAMMRVAVEMSEDDVARGQARFQCEERERPYARRMLEVYLQLVLGREATCEE